MKIIQGGNTTYAHDCLALARRLPQYFNAGGLKQMEQDIDKHSLYVAIGEDARVIAFATISEKSNDVAEISWMAVDSSLHRRRIGTTLMTYVCNNLADKGFKLIEVKTLSKIAQYEPYKRTRKFYESMEFVLLETINPYPAWGEGNPCAIYVKILR